MKSKQQIQRKGEGSGQTHFFQPSFLVSGCPLCLYCFWMMCKFSSKTSF